MTKRRTIALTALIVLVVVCLFVWLAKPAPQYLYEGRPVSAWLQELRQFNRWDTNDSAFIAFQNMETNPLPEVLAAAQQRRSRLEELVEKLNHKQSLIKIPSKETWLLNASASMALYAMGTNARPAIPVLTNMLFRTNDFVSALALAGIGSEALPSLLQALTNRDVRIRRDAATALGMERTDRDAVVYALMAELGDNDTMVREFTINSLGELHTHSELVVPALMTNYYDPHAVLRGYVMTSLARFETNAHAAIPLIKTALNDNDETTRHLAEDALRQIDPNYLQSQQK